MTGVSKMQSSAPEIWILRPGAREGDLAPVVSMLSTCFPRSDLVTLVNTRWREGSCRIACVGHVGSWAAWAIVMPGMVPVESFVRLGGGAG